MEDKNGQVGSTEASRNRALVSEIANEAAGLAMSRLQEIDDDTWAFGDSGGNSSVEHFEIRAGLEIQAYTKSRRGDFGDPDAALRSLIGTLIALRRELAR